MLASSAAISLLCVTLAVPTACGQSNAAAPLPSGQSSVTSPVVPTVLLTLNVSGFTESTEAVLREPGALADAWKTAHSGIPGNPPPSIDFAKQMVVLVAIGSRNTGGYTVRVDSVSRASDGALVSYTVVSPGPTCMTPQMITSPTVAVSVPRIDGSVQFKRSDVVDHC